MIQKWIILIAFVLSGLRGESDTLVITITIEDVPLAVEENIVPTEFHTYSAFPNPFNNVVVLKWDISNETNFSVSIFDVLGRQVWFKNCGKVMPGQYSIRWNGKDIYYQTVSGGIYFVRTRTGENVTQQKILFLK
jgi:hypothetical protein